MEVTIENGGKEIAQAYEIKSHMSSGLQIELEEYLNSAIMGLGCSIEGTTRELLEVCLNMPFLQPHNDGVHSSPPQKSSKSNSICLVISYSSPFGDDQDIVRTLYLALDQFSVAAWEMARLNS